LGEFHFRWGHQWEDCGLRTGAFELTGRHSAEQQGHYYPH
jgi:hypothetical protein